MHLPSIFLSGMSLFAVLTAAAPISSLLSEPALYGPTIENAIVEKRVPSPLGIKPSKIEDVVVAERAPSVAAPKIKDVVVERAPSDAGSKIMDVVVERAPSDALTRIEDVVVKE